jgi:hypothetical protein
MFFGTAAAGAVLGPSTAREVAQNVRYDQAYASHNSRAMKGFATSEDYRIERIADLKRILAGGDSREDSRARQRELVQHLEDVDKARLNTLRSVSDGLKVIMLADGRASRYERMRLMDAEWELAELESNLLKFPWEPTPLTR